MQDNSDGLELFRINDISFFFKPRKFGVFKSKRTTNNFDDFNII